MKRSIGISALAFVAWICGQVSIRADEVTKETKLFNGRDLTNFYTYLGSPAKGEKPYGKNNDPEKVFTIVQETRLVPLGRGLLRGRQRFRSESQGMIRVSGKVFGAITTEKEYENYHLVVEFKWGQQTFPPRAKATRDSGILLHCVGDDGVVGGWWMESIECQMIEGGTGDFILVAGKGKPRITARAEKRDGQFYYNPKAEPMEFTSGRINWYARDPKWKDVLGFRGEHDVENPLGQWNRLECICAGDKITNLLNGKVVNEGTKASHTKGKLQFQSEGAEVFFRRIDLLPLKK